MEPVFLTSASLGQLLDKYEFPNYQPDSIYFGHPDGVLPMINMTAYKQKLDSLGSQIIDEEGVIKLGDVRQMADGEYSRDKTHRDFFIWNMIQLHNFIRGHLQVKGKRKRQNVSAMMAEAVEKCRRFNRDEPVDTTDAPMKEEDDTTVETTDLFGDTTENDPVKDEDDTTKYFDAEATETTAEQTGEESREDTTDQDAKEDRTDENEEKRQRVIRDLTLNIIPVVQAACDEEIQNGANPWDSSEPVFESLVNVTAMDYEKEEGDKLWEKAGKRTLEEGLLSPPACQVLHAVIYSVVSCDCKANLLLKMAGGKTLELGVDWNTNGPNLYFGNKWRAQLCKQTMLKFSKHPSWGAEVEYKVCLTSMLKACSELFGETDVIDSIGLKAIPYGKKGDPSKLMANLRKQKILLGVYSMKRNDQNTKHVTITIKKEK